MLITLALTCMMAQDPAAEPGVTTGTDRGSAIHITVTGHVDLHYVYRSEKVDLAGSALNFGVASAAGSQNFWAGRIGLRADVEVKDLVSGVIELENRSFESGANEPFSSSPPRSNVQIRQGYIEVGEFLAP